MARRRYYYRFRRTKPKWTVNAVDLNPSVSAQPALGSLEFFSTICTNFSGGVTSAVPIMKTGRFKIKGVITPDQPNQPTTQNPVYTFPSGSSLVIAVMYLPEGVGVDSTPRTSYDISNYLFYKHQEWVMGWTRMDYIDWSQRNEFSITSRLKRNLNKGDSVAVVYILYNRNTAIGTPGFKVQASATYACRTN